MNNYFDKYLEAKFALCRMISQFSTTFLTCDEAVKNNIKFNDKDITFSNYIEICFHDYDSNSLLAWEYLNLEKDYMTHEEVWEYETKIKEEEYDENKDYYKEYLKICILLIDMTNKYYKMEFELDNVNKNRVLYDKEDEFDNKVIGCHHIYESAGEAVWDLFEINYPVVGLSFFEKKRKYYVNELLERDKQKVLKREYYDIR